MALSSAAWCVVAAFGTYFCMYAFRKPFTASEYTDITLAGVGYKSVLVIAQVLGYMVSKFVGIKVISELPAHRRAGVLLMLVGCAEAALLLFAVTPTPFNFVWLFSNGLPLGMVFGLVLGFLEGRRHTEALAAGLCASFILADGVTKSVGAYLLAAGVGPMWMPFTAGLLFLPPLLGFVWMLTRISAPSARDVEARSERSPMDAAERRRFFRRYAAGLIPLVVAYLLITVLRSVRADFAPEIWRGLGITNQPDIFAWSEVVVAALVVVLNGAVVFVRDNRRAFFLALAQALAGVGLVAAALVGLQLGSLTPFSFMVLHGLGLYLPYLAVHTTLFERLIAMTRDRGNIGYLMYVADAFGYLGYVIVLLARHLVGSSDRFLSFFVTLSWALAAACVVLLIVCWRAFAVISSQQAVAAAPELESAQAAGGA